MEVLFGEFCIANATKHFDDAFSTGPGLERDGITGLVCWLWMSGSSVKIRNKKDQRGSPVASPMLKLVLFCGREDRLLMK